MNSFKVLNALVPKERAYWLKLWKSWNDHEISAHPDYLRLFACQYDCSICAIFESPYGNVMFPFILRPINVEPWADKDCILTDIITPYGYGGVFAWGNPSADIFWNEFNKWAKKTRVVCCFARLSLFPDQLIPFNGKVETILPNVVRSLDIDLKEIWMDYEHKVRKNVKKALRSSLKLEVDLYGKKLKEFLQVYYSTMNRCQATESYYYNKDFFQRILKNLYGHYAFFHALYNGKVVSSELVLISANNLYSFLGGTDAEFFDFRPNDLLKHKIIIWGKNQGKKNFVLGGGYNRCDGIYRYKKSFSPKGELPFKVGKKIYLADEYKKLCIMRSDWEKNNGNFWEPKPNFFPSYRS